MGGLFQLCGGRSGDFQELGHCPGFNLYSWPQNCHGVGGCVIYMLIYYNEHIMRFKVYWKLNIYHLGLSWFYPVFVMSYATAFFPPVLTGLVCIPASHLFIVYSNSSLP